jgi:hypothetical protein
MPTLSLTKKDLPFLLGGKGEVSVDIGALRPTKPIPEDTDRLLSVSFSAGGDETITLGQSGTVKIGVSTAASLNLTPIFSTSTGVGAKLLKTYGISDVFKKGANADKVVLCLEAAASGDLSAAGSFSYAPLKATAEIKVGADAGYAYLRALDRTEAVKDIVPEFFSTMRLPEQGTRAPEPGEAISLQYGGYLKLGAELSAGYRLAGTKSISIGQLALSEKYDLSIVGKIGVSAGVAGRFTILVTAGDLPGWCRVQVRRHRAKDFKIAADVNVAFKNDLDLPANAKDFLGAALGVNAKNFINVFAKAVELSDFDAFKNAIDGLAKKYIATVIGKGFDALSSQTEFKKFLDLVHRVVTSYEEVEDRAVTLFDRYFDKLDQLTAFLDKIQGLPDGAIDTLRKDLSPELWTILSQLTDGDPLGFLLEQVTVAGKRVDSQGELKKRAGAVTSLIRDAAHGEIRRVIGLAKQQFGLDQLFAEAAKIDTVEELQALANEKVGLFITRLVGRSLDSATNLKQALNEVHAVLVKIDSFGENLFKAFKEATNATYKTALHAEYSRASETDSLVDVILNMANPRGAGLLALAGKGDFEEILTISDTDVVRLREGVFTHRTKRESAFKVNIIGWHLNYQYEGFDRVITETEQRLVPSDQGITVLTTASLEIERKRKRNDEETHVNFLLRALGESAGLVKPDPKSAGYIIDSLSSLTARYQLNFTDDDTSSIELKDYLAFAESLGLDGKGATLEEVAPLLPKDAAGSFGKVATSYDVRFGEPAMKAMLSVKKLSAAAEQSVRNSMREMLLSNYLKGGDSLHDVAFAYATPGIFTRFMNQGFAAFIGGSSDLVFPISIANAGISAPTSVTLDRTERQILTTIYNIENQFVDALKNLIELVAAKKIDPAKFEKAAGKFGDAMKDFDNFDQTSNQHGVGTSTVFALFDQLVRLAAGGPSANAAALHLISQVGDRQVEKLYLSDAAA